MIRIRHTPFLGQPGHLPHPLAASTRHRDLRRERKDIPLRKQIRPEKEVSALFRVDVIIYICTRIALSWCPNILVLKNEIITYLLK